MKDVDYMHVAEDSINKIKEGAFLTVKSGNALNTMTIGWASFGMVWRRPRRRKPGFSSKEGGLQNGLATRRLATINRRGKYLRSLTQIENYSTKREPEATIFSIMRGHLCILSFCEHSAAFCFLSLLLPGLSIRPGI